MVVVHRSDSEIKSSAGSPNFDVGLRALEHRLVITHPDGVKSIVEVEVLQNGLVGQSRLHREAGLAAREVESPGGEPQR